MRTTSCAVDGCERVAERRGWCHRHYQRWWQHGDPSGVESFVAADCAIAGCPNFALRGGRYHDLCRTHYQQVYRREAPR